MQIDQNVLASVTAAAGVAGKECVKVLAAGAGEAALRGIKKLIGGPSGLVSRKNSEKPHDPPPEITSGSIELSEQQPKCRPLAVPELARKINIKRGNLVEHAQIGEGGTLLMAETIGSVFVGQKHRPKSPSTTCHDRARRIARRAKNLVKGRYEIGQLRAAAALAEQATVIDPTLPMAWGIRARVTALFILRGWAADGALSLAKNAREFAEKANALSTEQGDGDAHFALGIVDVFEHIHTDAEDHYRCALAILPKDASIISALGFVFLYQGRLDEALGLFRQSMELDRANPVRHFDLAICYAAQKEYSRASDEAGAAIDLDPIRPLASAVLLKAWLDVASKGSLAEMKQTLNRLELDDRRLDEAIHIVMWCGLLRRQPDEVLDAALRANSTYFDHYVFCGPVAWHTALAYRLLGNEYLEQCEWSSAAEVLDDLLTRFPHKKDTLHYRVQLAITRAWLNQDDDSARKTILHAETVWSGRELTASRARELAGYYAALGNAARAVPLIERALGADSGPGGLTVQLLRLDPWWDKLRPDYRFKRLIRLPLPEIS
jgi:tetratricopeptide (TPR) repeat protein